MATVFDRSPFKRDGFSSVFRRAFDLAYGDPYRDGAAVDEIEPDFLYDPSQNVYFVDKSRKSKDQISTFSRSSNATMVDSDGLLKWAPHNLLTYSDSLDQWSNSFSGGVDLTLNAKTDSNGNVTLAKIARIDDAADGIFEFSTVSLGVSVTVAAEVAAGDSGVTLIGLNESGVSGFQGELRIAWSGGTPSTSSSDNATNIVYSYLGNDSWLASFDTTTGTTNTTQGIIVQPSPEGSNGEFFYAGKFRIYRSDLGGMVNNPATGNSYVPTTSSAKYLSRVGHHVYNGSEWVNEGEWIEPEARTNVLLYSQDLTNAVWEKAGAEAGALSVSSSITDPEGGSTAFRVSGLRDSSKNRFRQLLPAAAAAGETYTPNVWVRIESGTSDLFIENAYAGSNGLIVVPNSGDWVEVNPLTIAPSQAFVGDGSGNISLQFSRQDTSGDDLAIDIWHPQVEIASTPSSYIPTAGATATRAADTLSIPAENLPYDSTAMTIAMEGMMTYADTDGFNEAQFISWSVDANDQIALYLRNSGTRTGEVQFQQDAGGTTDLVSGTGVQYSPGVNVPFNIASRHTSSDINGAVDGTALTANTTPTALPDLSSTDMDLASVGGGIIIKTLRIWGNGVGLTDTQLESATS